MRLRTWIAEPDDSAEQRKNLVGTARLHLGTPSLYGTATPTEKAEVALVLEGMVSGDAPLGELMMTWAEAERLRQALEDALKGAPPRKGAPPPYFLKVEVK